MTRPVFGWRVALVSVLSCGPVFAQQFQNQVGAVPGPVVWTEGLVAFDADGDGDLEVVFANGDGFNTAGTARLPTFLTNNGVVSGNPAFVDETATRLPNIVMNAKGVIAFDVEDDGDEDLLFVQGYNKQPRLYLNNGTGFFTDATATNIPTINLNSFSAGAGDVDNDGDLDVTLAHHGGTNLTGTGGKLQLWLNNGSGVFTDVTATQVPNGGKTSQMNATFVDIDSDFDLDVILDGRSVNQNLYTNNGSGSFTLSTSTLPAGSSSIYETDWADLDGDTDIDGFYISLSGFTEGTAKNNLVETSALTFTGSSATITGTNGDDDNEVVFVDYDDDGDLDPVVGSLSGGREKLYRNNGNFTFASQNQFTALTDSTLDMTVGDFDGDGDYDAVTVQGESGGFTNRYYRNTGAPDSRDPLIGARKVTSADSVAPFVVLTRITDATMDDGQQWIDATVNWMVTPLVGSPVIGSTPMRYFGGSIYRGVIDSGPMSDYRANVSWSVTATDAAGNSVTSSTQNFIGCGREVYGIGAGGANVLLLDVTGSPRIGSTISIDVAGGQPNATGIMILGAVRVNTPFAGGTLLTLPLSVIGVPVGPGGSASYPAPIPDNVSIVGATVQLQMILADPSQSQGAALSNGLELTICPK